MNEELTEGPDAEEGNLAAAVAAAAKDSTMSTPSDPDTKEQVQVLTRVDAAERDRWKLAAETLGVSMTQMINDAVSAYAAKQLDCTHPAGQTRDYPWAFVCLACGFKLEKGKSVPAV